MIDEAVFQFFERVALDQDSARKAFSDQVERELSGLAAMEQQAETELTRAEARLARITRGWQDGVIDDAEYQQQRQEVRDEREAAGAQLERQQERRREIEQAAAQISVADA